MFNVGDIVVNCTTKYRITKMVTNKDGNYVPFEIEVAERLQDKGRIISGPWSRSVVFTLHEALVLPTLEELM
jgi:hypothetical protein